MDFFDTFKKLLGLEEGPHFSKAEIARHNTRESLWIVADGKVYDVTQFLDQHAGGAQSILKRGGGVQDCSRDIGFHSVRAQALWKTFQIGFVASDGKTDEEGRNYLRSRGFLPVEDLAKVVPTHHATSTAGVASSSKNASFDKNAEFNNKNDIAISTTTTTTSSAGTNTIPASVIDKKPIKCAGSGRYCTFHFEEDLSAPKKTGEPKTPLSGNGGATSTNCASCENAGKEAH